MILQRNDVSNSVWNCLIDVITNREDSLIKTMNFYMKNIDQLSDNSKFPLDSTLSIFVLKIRSEELLNKMIDFQQKRLENNKYLIFNTIPQAKYNVQWYKQNAPCLEKWIKEVLPGFLAQM
ncbi:hypothetical protein C0J52_12041 [Blattella germanica]|nr:hypothetical protein C0J52_12041 [Blattella germanica]